jgi:hypothetical protein
VEIFGFWALFLIRGYTAQGSKMFYDTGKFIDGLFQSNDRPVWDMLPGDVAQRLPAGKRRNPDRNERTKESETPPKTGAGTTAEGTGKMNTETIPKHNNFTGHSLPCP